VANSHRRTFLTAILGLPFALRKVFSTPTVVDVDLEARQGWMRVAGRTAYLYGDNGRVPGSMIEARPGDHVRVRFRNALAEPTNVHYHGLRVSPSDHADNVMLRVPAGESLTYEFDPSSHASRTKNWRFRLNPPMRLDAGNAIFRRGSPSQYRHRMEA
jgi:FtsP/CotA-like multicopper oxidase with cupredoxin domain